MIAILTSSLGGSYKVNGRRFPTYLLDENGLTDKIKHFWKNDSKVLIISAEPEEFERNDSILFCQKEAFAMSGLEAYSFEICDYRNEALAEKINEYDVITTFSRCKRGYFIISLDGDETLYGEAFLIRDGKQMQVCKKGEFVQL